MSKFIFSDVAEPHRMRTRQILKSHPGVRKLIGKNPFTFIAIIGLVSAQIILSYFLKDVSWILVFAIAWLVGAFIDHSLFVMIHECSHNLIFKKRNANYFASIVANLPQIFPSAISFHRYHIKHHSFQGIHELDADLPDYFEAKMVNNRFLGKIFWLLFYPIVQTARVFRLKEIKPVNGWIILNWLACILFSASIIYFFGAKAFVYLVASFFFSVGLHPLGARWIQEHYVVHGEQETYSYYGPLNNIAFNVGYHNEHHDFPSIPWNKLPQLKNSAPEFYDSLYSHTSWIKLWFRFLTDKNLSLFNRVIRNDRGGVKLTDESKPDAEMVGETVNKNAVPVS
jgi:sphingolipid delta-4 desaturase